MANDIDNVVVLRSVYGKVGMKYYIMPAIDPLTGRFPNCVKHIDSKGDMILTEKERNSGAVYIPENRVFIVEDGKTYNLDDPYEAAEWYSIQHCPIIAMSRDQRDRNGNLVIDGTPKKYGAAELYVEKPGLEVHKKVNRRKLILQASNLITGDPKGADGRMLMAKILGRTMRNAADADVEDYLLSIAEKEPNRIIELYSDNQIGFRILFVEAREKQVIYTKNKLYVYGDDAIILGATDDAVITFLCNPNNSRVVELIKKDTFPELAGKSSK